jgi:hypothetical protein
MGVKVVVSLYTFTGGNHSLNILNGGGGGNLESEGVTSKGLNKELHVEWERDGTKRLPVASSFLTKSKKFYHP